MTQEQFHNLEPGDLIKIPTQKFEGYAILEILGHRRLGGFVTETDIAGHGFLRIDIPDEGDTQQATHLGNVVPGLTTDDLGDAAVTDAELAGKSGDALAVSSASSNSDDLVPGQFAVRLAQLRASLRTSIALKRRQSLSLLRWQLFPHMSGGYPLAMLSTLWLPSIRRADLGTGLRRVWLSRSALARRTQLRPRLRTNRTSHHQSAEFRTCFGAVRFTRSPALGCTDPLPMFWSEWLAFMGCAHSGTGLRRMRPVLRLVDEVVPSTPIAGAKCVDPVLLARRQRSLVAHDLENSELHHGWAISVESPLHVAIPVLVVAQISPMTSAPRRQVVCAPNVHLAITRVDDHIHAHLLRTSHAASTSRTGSVYYITLTTGGFHDFRN